MNSVSASLDADFFRDCQDKDSLLKNADYVIVGEVSKIKTSSDDGNIYTYQYISISDYIKGDKLANNLLIIKSLGGCLGTRCQGVEDGDPILEKNKKYTLYLSNNGKYFSIYCMGYGVKSINSLDKDELYDKEPSESIMEKDHIEIIEDKGAMIIKDKDLSLKTSNELIIEEEKLLIKTKDGKKEIKIAPSTAYKTAVNQLNLEEAEIELKEAKKPVYEVSGNKEIKIIGLFKKEMSVITQIDAKTGKIEKIKNLGGAF